MRSFIDYIVEATKPTSVNLLKTEFEKALVGLIAKEVTPTQIAKAVNTLGEKYQFSARARTAPELERGDTSITAYFDIGADKQSVKWEDWEPSIEILLVFSPKEKKIAYTKETISDLAKTLAETLSHELMHRSQAKARNWKEVKAKKEYVSSVKLKRAAAYLAADDEIEAHAWNIAGALLDTFGNKRLSIDFLNKPKTGVLPDQHFDQYLQVFGKGHEVIKRLYKKITFYLDTRNEK